MSYTPTTVQLRDLADQLIELQSDPLDSTEITQSLIDAFEDYDMSDLDVRDAFLRLQLIITRKVAPQLRP